MRIRCNGCHGKIKRPGGLLFGPPVAMRTKKWHLCRTCYAQVAYFIRFSL